MERTANVGRQVEQHDDETGGVRGDAENATARLHLRQLAPQYDPAHHDTYAQALYDVCNPTDGSPQPRNVSLMGSYGTGKSSIIQGFEQLVRDNYRHDEERRFDQEYPAPAKQHGSPRRIASGPGKIARFFAKAAWNRRVDRELADNTTPGCIGVTSLLLCPEGARRDKGQSDGGETRESTETHEIDGRAYETVRRKETVRKPSDDDRSESGQTEEIQKEIIKQLIYGVRPSDVNGSHFRRLRSRHRPSEYLRPMALVALALVVLTVVVGLWSSGFKPADFAKGLKGWTVIWAVLTVSGCGLVAMFLDRLQTFSIQATISDSVSLSVDERHTIDIFDKYVDEIVYLLEKERTRYVVFEDLDRASDWRIYYELRELNTLINASTRTHGQTVTFIYVMGDDAMDTNRYDEKQGEWPEGGSGLTPFDVAERKAKFFDVNVYVRPFVTVGNAGAVFRDMLRDDGSGAVGGDVDGANGAVAANGSDDMNATVTNGGKVGDGNVR